jgi:hypothetical protein
MYSPFGPVNRKAFVVTFISRKDRDYYVELDPMHTAFTKTLSAVDDVVVVDFEDML